MNSVPLFQKIYHFSFGWTLLIGSIGWNFARGRERERHSRTEVQMDISTRISLIMNKFLLTDSSYQLITYDDLALAEYFNYTKVIFQQIWIDIKFKKRKEILAKLNWFH